MEKLDKELAKELMVAAPNAGGGRLQFTNDLRLSDPDSTYIFVILKDWQWMKNRMHGKREPPIVESPEFFRFLLESRIPAFPAWYVTGITRLYESARATGAVLDVAPDPWLSIDAVRILLSKYPVPRPLLPLRELLLPLYPKRKSAKYQAVWEAQAGLLVRWVYAEKVTGAKENLRRLVSMAGNEPTTEQLFRSCFGMNFADARDVLSDYLSESVQTVLKLPASPAPTNRPIELAPATAIEIRRIKGEWARRTLGVIKQNYPEAYPLFIEKTRKFLQQGYDRGQRDPQLLASLALFLIDTGDPTGARKIFKSHSDAISARPLAALAQAQLHFDDTVRSANARGTKIDDAEAANIMDEVTTISRKIPLIEGAYVLGASVLQNRQTEPTSIERTWLDNGARLFCRNSALSIVAASFDLRAGDFAKARSLLELALWESDDASAQKKLATLRDLAANAMLIQNEPAKSDPNSR
jgi:hypothetical protein